MRSMSVAVPLCKGGEDLGVGRCWLRRELWSAVMRLPCSRSMATNGAMTARTLSLVTSPPKTPLRRGAPILLQYFVAEVALDEVGYAFVCRVVRKTSVRRLVLARCDRLR